MIFTEDEKELIVYGLQMRRNYVETGDSLLSASDAKAMGQDKKIRALMPDQHGLIVRLHALTEKVTKM